MLVDVELAGWDNVGLTTSALVAICGGNDQYAAVLPLAAGL